LPLLPLTSFISEMTSTSFSKRNIVQINDYTIDTYNTHNNSIDKAYNTYSTEIRISEFINNLDKNI
jgi:hypothetical protein